MARPLRIEFPGAIYQVTDGIIKGTYICADACAFISKRGKNSRQELSMPPRDSPSEFLL
jgi:hypothetical protein